MDNNIGEITLPAGKTVTLNRERFRVTEDAVISADILESVPKQKTAMRKLVCTHCGFTARATKKYKDRILVCVGTEAQAHDAQFLHWVDDDAQPAEVVEIIAA